MEAAAARCLQSGEKRVAIQARQLLAGGIDAFPGLEHLRVQRRRSPDFQRKEVGAVLVGDQQRVGKTGGNDQQGGLATPLKQRVGGHRGAHLEVPHRAFAAAFGDQRADRMHGCVGITGRIIGQQLADPQRSAGGARHHVRERAAAINPEPPSGHAGIVRRAIVGA